MEHVQIDPYRIDTYRFDTDIGSTTIMFMGGAARVWVTAPDGMVRLHVKVSGPRGYELFRFYEQFAEPKRVR